VGPYATFSSNRYIGSQNNLAIEVRHFLDSACQVPLPIITHLLDSVCVPYQSQEGVFASGFNGTTQRFRYGWEPDPSNEPVTFADPSIYGLTSLELDPPADMGSYAFDPCGAPAQTTYISVDTCVQISEQASVSLHGCSDPTVPELVFNLYDNSYCISDPQMVSTTSLRGQPCVAGVVSNFTGLVFTCPAVSSISSCSSSSGGAGFTASDTSVEPDDGDDSTFASTASMDMANMPLWAQIALGVFISCSAIVVALALLVLAWPACCQSRTAFVAEAGQARPNWSKWSPAPTAEDGQLLWRIMGFLRMATIGAMVAAMVLNSACTRRGTKEHLRPTYIGLCAHC